MQRTTGRTFLPDILEEKSEESLSPPPLDPTVIESIHKIAREGGPDSLDLLIAKVTRATEDLPRKKNVTFSILIPSVVRKPFQPFED